MTMLHEQGKFEMDDHVSDYLPCFESLVVQDGDSVRPATQPLTIEHLMSHRSGGYYSGWEDALPTQIQSSILFLLGTTVHIQTNTIQ